MTRSTRRSVRQECYVASFYSLNASLLKPNIKVKGT